MIKVQKFDLSVLSTHKMFFHLNKLDAGLNEVDVWIQKPDGFESVDFIDVFSMDNGALIAAWKHPFQKLPLYNVVVFGNGKTQIVNLHSFEKMFEIYNKPVDSGFGVFSFVNSMPIASEHGDWRCDIGYYGPEAFDKNVQAFESLEEIIFYEPILNVNGIGQIIYTESRKATEKADYYVNHSYCPYVGRTFQETLRLIWEWSVMADEPFNSNEEIALKAEKFIDAMDFSEDELNVIKDQTSMQVENFIRSKPNARLRPNDVQSMSSGIENIINSRVAHSSLSMIVRNNPMMFDYVSIYNAECVELQRGIERFCDYYKIEDFDSWTSVDAYSFNQLNFFKNKKMVLGLV
jgi:hypothetical protein